MKYWQGGPVRLATDELRKAVAGKKIALMMNTSAIDNEGRLLVDTMASEKWAKEIAFFLGMEHGVRGNLYASHGDTTPVDALTGIKIESLYQFPGGCPPAELCAQVEAVVFCAQDVGVRHWTYTPWMMRLMDSCAQSGTEVIVLDRPNPIRGDIVEGAPAEKYVASHLLSGFEYPLRHGMTIGELALMYNDVKKIGAKLTVLKMEGWKRNMWYNETGLIWAPPSPNIPTMDSPLYFAATGLMQSGNFSLAHGTPTPFQYFGRPDVSGQAIADELNSRDLPGIFFVPKFYMCRFGGDMQLCDGVLMVINDRDAWRPVHTQLNIMDTLAKLYPDIYDPEASPKYARPRMNTDKICDAIKNKQSLKPVMEEWLEGAKRFEEQRKPYLLYD